MQGGCQVVGNHGSQEQAILEAQNAMSLNAIGGTHLSVDASDFEFGFSNRENSNSRYGFTSNSENVNAVRMRTDALMASAGSNLRFPLPLGVGNISFRPMQDATASLAELDVCLVVDRSGSMAYGATEVADGLVPPASAPPDWVFGQPVPPGSRWLDAVAAVEAFFGVLGETPQEERVCLATYNHLPYYDVELTGNYGLIRDRLNLYSSAFEAGATNIGDGMSIGMNLLQNSPSKRDWSVRVMIVLTDGRHNWGTWPTDSARGIASDNVVIHTVTFALEADQALMGEVASIGGGRHYHATNEAELIEVFREIARSLPVMLTD